MTTASARVLQISELVCLISQFVEVRSLARLAPTSKAFFDASIPHIWRAIPGASPLLQFLPCNFSDEAFEKRLAKYSGSISLLRSLSEADFERFKIYARHVRRLDLFVQSQDPKLVLGWKVLLDYVDAGHILLPNLEVLALEPPHGMYSEIDSYPWIRAFCSPALRTLTISSLMGRLSPRITSTTLHLLSRTCQNLVALDFTPLLVSGYGSRQDQYASPEYDEIDYAPALLHPGSSLRHLSIPLNFLVTYFPYIDQIKNLEQLKIRGSSQGSIQLAKLPSALFPALTAIDFDQVLSSIVESMWEFVPAMFNEQGKSYNVSEFLLRLATTMNRISPNITELVLHFGPLDVQEGDRIIHVDEETIQLLGRLPLQRLSVESVAINATGDGATEGCSLLASTFRSVRVLRWTHQKATYEDLHAFANMPNLQRLVLNLADAWPAVELEMVRHNNCLKSDVPHFRYV